VEYSKVIPSSSRPVQNLKHFFDGLANDVKKLACWSPAR